MVLGKQSSHLEKKILYRLLSLPDIFQMNQKLKCKSKPLKH